MLRLVVGRARAILVALVLRYIGRLVWLLAILPCSSSSSLLLFGSATIWPTLNRARVSEHGRRCPSEPCPCNAHTSTERWRISASRKEEGHGRRTGSVQYLQVVRIKFEAGELLSSSSTQLPLGGFTPEISTKCRAARESHQSQRRDHSAEAKPRGRRSVCLLCPPQSIQLHRPTCRQYQTATKVYLGSSHAAWWRV